MSASFKRRLHDGSMLGSPNYRPPRDLSTPRPGPEGEYGVERDGDEIVLSLGLVPPFRVPVQTAIKLALLILRRCGVEVDLG